MSHLYAYPTSLWSLVTCPSAVLLLSAFRANVSHPVSLDYKNHALFDALFHTFIHYAIININIFLPHLYSSSCRHEQPFFHCC